MPQERSKRWQVEGVQEGEHRIAMYCKNKYNVLHLQEKEYDTN